LPAITSSETTDQTLKICVNHVDDVPRFLNLHLVKKGKAQLIGKEYLSENDSEGCFQFQLTPKQLRSDLEININDAYGNQSAMQPINLE